MMEKAKGLPRVPMKERIEKAVTKMRNVKSQKSILENHLAWKEYVAEDERLKAKSLIKGVHEGKVTSVPVPHYQHSLLPKQVENKEVGVEEVFRSQSQALKPQLQSRFPPRDIFGRPQESALRALQEYHSLQGKYPTDLHKGLERNMQLLELEPIRGGIKTFEEGKKLPYMSTSISLSQPDFAFHTITTPQQKSGKGSELHSPSNSRGNQSLVMAGEMVLGKQRVQQKREEMRREFYKAKAQDQETYHKQLNERVTIKDLFRNKDYSESFKMPTSNHVYGAYKHPSKFVVRGPVDKMKMLMNSHNVGFTPADEAYLLRSIN